MSTTLYVALDRSIDGLELNNERVLLAKLVGDAARMATLCGQLGVDSLSDFQSYDRELLAEFIDTPNMLESAIAKAQRTEFFRPSEALPIVKALRLHFETQHGASRLVGELHNLEEVLSHAESAGAKFRLYVGF
jgi:hypothetical protein